MIGCRHDSPPEIRCRHNVARHTRLLGHLRLPSADCQRRLVCRRTRWRHVDLRLVSKVTRWDRHEPMDMARRDCDSCGDHAGDGTQGKSLASGWVLCKLERHQTIAVSRTPYGTVLSRLTLVGSYEAWQPKRKGGTALTGGGNNRACAVNTTVALFSMGTTAIPAPQSLDTRPATLNLPRGPWRVFRGIKPK